MWTCCFTMSQELMTVPIQLWGQRWSKMTYKVLIVSDIWHFGEVQGKCKLKLCSAIVWCKLGILAEAWIGHLLNPNFILKPNITKNVTVYGSSFSDLFHVVRFWRRRNRQTCPLNMLGIAHQDFFFFFQQELLLAYVWTPYFWWQRGIEEVTKGK